MDILRFDEKTYWTWLVSPPKNSKSISSPPSAIKIKAVTEPPAPADLSVADNLPNLMYAVEFKVGPLPPNLLKGRSAKIQCY